MNNAKAKMGGKFYNYSKLFELLSRVYGLARKTLQMVHSPGLAASHPTIWSISTKINTIHPIQNIIQD
jgi:hypothetical protein